MYLIVRVVKDITEVYFFFKVYKVHLHSLQMM